MSEAISGVAGQIFQQALENQTINQQTTESSGKKTFESYMQQDKPAQIPQDSDGAKKAETVEKIQNPTTSGAEMQKKLEAQKARIHVKD